jgi:hypothetical protein
MGIIYIMQSDIYYHKYQKYKSKYLALTNTQIGGNLNNLLKIGGFSLKSYKIILFNRQDITNYSIFSAALGEPISNAETIQNIINKSYGNPAPETNQQTQDQDAVISVRKIDLYNQLNEKAYETTFNNQEPQLIRSPTYIFIDSYEHKTPLAKIIFLNGVFGDILEQNNIVIMNNINKSDLQKLNDSIKKYSSQRSHYTIENTNDTKLKEAFPVYEQFMNESFNENDRAHILNIIIKRLISDPKNNKEIISSLDREQIKTILSRFQVQAGGSLFPNYIIIPRPIQWNANYRMSIMSALVSINNNLKNVNKNLDTALILMEGRDPNVKARVYEILFLKDYLPHLT